MDPRGRWPYIRHKSDPTAKLGVSRRRNGPQGSFTVRKISFGQGVERIFPFNSKVLDKVEVVRSNQVRRAKLFYLRGLKGKAARLREIDRVVATQAAPTQSEG